MNDEKPKKKCPYHEWGLDTAVHYLRELLQEFPFADWTEETYPDGEVFRQSRSQAVQLAAMLSMFCKGLVPKGTSRMGFIYDANSPRSGKTLLAKLAIIPIYGSFRAQTWNPKDEELRKVIDAEVLAASGYVCFDNVRGYIASPVVEALMTTSDWTGRVLGKTQMFTVTNNMTVFMTGNQCLVQPDIGHRCLKCELHLDTNNVHDRGVENIIDDYWLQQKENRINILSALWAIVRSWEKAGRPSASSFGYRPFSGFERWCEVIGGLVAHAGFGNCLEQPTEREYGGAPENKAIVDLISLIIEKEPGVSVIYRNFQEVVDICHENALFDWLLDGRMKEGNYEVTTKVRSSFGLLLGRYAPYVGDTKNPKKPISYKIDFDGQQKTVYFGCKGKFRHKKYFVDIPHIRGETGPMTSHD
jgi:hypothetical protein